MGRAQDSTSVDMSDEPLRGSTPSETIHERARTAPRQSEPRRPQRQDVDLYNQQNLPAAFDLISEACAAVKIAEDRVHFAEEALEDATSHYVEQIETLTERLNIADLRAEVAERHAARAEERLRIFCQTILTTMHKM